MPSNHDSHKDHLLFCIAAGICIAIFVIDQLIELGVAIGIAYVAALWVIAHNEDKNQLRLFSLISVALILVGWALSPGGGEPWKIAVNRMLSLSAIGFCYALIGYKLEATLLERRLAAIVDSSEDSIVGVNMDGLIRDWNPASERLYGYAASEIIGQTTERLVPKHLQAQGLAVGARIMNGERFTNIDSPRLHKDGHIVQTNATISPIFDARGALSGVSVISRDDSERRAWAQELKELNNQLTKANEALELSNEELQQFAFIASHDLQAPLRHITSFTQLLEMQYANELGEQGLDWIARTVDSTRHMQSLIDDLLAFSRIEASKIEFDRVDAQHAVANALEHLSEFIDERHATVTVEKLPSLMADEVQMVQLFENLIGNGIKYNTNKRPIIHIQCEILDEEALFAVSDNGIGVAEEFSNQIFEIFKRLHSKDAYDGTGIGLAICKRIVNRHGGRIWLESNQDQGSTFFFTLPAATISDASRVVKDKV